MKKISISELPKYSSWPKRLLSGAAKAEPRTEEKILREYDRDKFGTYLAYFNEHPKSSWKTIRQIEQLSDAKVIPVSCRGELVLAQKKEALALRERAFLKSVESAMKTCDTVIELGTGYGYNLSLLHSKYPKHTYIGGELSENGRALGTLLARKSGIVFYPFNFYDPTWEIFSKTASKKILILTVHATEMIPRSSLFIQGLARHQSRITRVVQIEPLYELCSEADLLGLLRRRYIEVNDYNRDLYSALSKKGTVIHSLKNDEWSWNPVFPESHIVWSFKK